MSRQALQKEPFAFWLFILSWNSWRQPGSVPTVMPRLTEQWAELVSSKSTGTLPGPTWA